MQKTLPLFLKKQYRNAKNTTIISKNTARFMKNPAKRQKTLPILKNTARFLKNTTEMQKILPILSPVDPLSFKIYRGYIPCIPCPSGAPVIIVHIFIRKFTMDDPVHYERKIILKPTLMVRQDFKG